MTKRTIEDAASILAVVLDKYDWFYDIVIENGGKTGKLITVYVEHMGEDVSSIVPDVYDGYQVILGFAQYLNCGRKYGIKLMNKSKIIDYPEEY